MPTKKLAFILLILTSLQAEEDKRFVVLPASAVQGVVRSEGDWTPTENDLKSVEQNISQIGILKAENWAISIHIAHPKRYFRQYVPIRDAGRNILYINAVCNEPPPKDWRVRLVVVSDGAACFWQALYDPERKSFTHLTINGRG